MKGSETDQHKAPYGTEPAFRFFLIIALNVNSSKHKKWTQIQRVTFFNNSTQLNIITHYIQTPSKTNKHNESYFLFLNLLRRIQNVKYHVNKRFYLLFESWITNGSPESTPSAGEDACERNSI